MSVGLRTIGFTSGIRVLLRQDGAFASRAAIARRQLRARLEGWGGETTHESSGMSAVVSGLAPNLALPDLLSFHYEHQRDLMLLWPTGSKNAWLDELIETPTITTIAFAEALSQTSDALLWWFGSADSPDAFLCIVAAENRLLNMARAGSRFVVHC